jgi:hypothetical protein
MGSPRASVSETSVVKNRPKVEKISEQMREWSTLLGQELQTWSGVTSRPMFGMTAFYRNEIIFSVLPRTLSFETPTSVGFKLYQASSAISQLLHADPRIALPTDRETGWITFEIQDSRDLTRALEWLMRAYRSCATHGAAHPRKHQAPHR